MGCDIQNPIVYKDLKATGLKIKDIKGTLARKNTYVFFGLIQ